jgi:hypothetical protein
MTQFDDLFGCVPVLSLFIGLTCHSYSSILVSSWLSAMLYGVVLCQTWEYISTYPKEARFRKILLLCCLTTSMLALIAEFANVYYVREAAAVRSLYLWILCLAYRYFLG